MENIDFNFSDNEGKDIKSINGNNVFKHSFTTYTGGFYSLCLKNNNHKTKDKSTIADISFSIKHGIAAKDYSSVSKIKDLKPVDLSVGFKFVIFI